MGILLQPGQKLFYGLARSLQCSMNIDNFVIAPISFWKYFFAIVVSISLSFAILPTAQAMEPKSISSEIPLGERIFTSNCAACHIGGNNVILAERNLSKEALAKYSMDSIVAIKTQVIMGKNAMPAFGDNLTSAEIEAVARYVLTQSQQGWTGSSVGLH